MAQTNCLMCGVPFPKGTVASRKYCVECYEKREMAARQRRREKRKQEKKDAPPPPKPLSPEKTLSSEDRRYCERCIYAGRFTAGYLCNYIFMTGERRGCPAGVGCKRKTLVAQFKSGTKKRSCLRCGEKLTGGKYAKYCDKCRFELHQEAALHMIEIKKKENLEHGHHSAG